MSDLLTDRQQLVLDYVRNSILKNGYSPSVRDICKDVGIKSTSTVHSYLKTLTKFGYIEMNDTISRSIRIPGNLKQPAIGTSVEVPIIGQVAAGSPILAVENIEDTFIVSSEYTKNSSVFMLKVKGNSMVDVGIFEGDLILVKQQSTAENGDIVVALIEDEATVKTYYVESDHIRLQPENSSMDPILIYGDILIVGKVIGLFRTY